MKKLLTVIVILIALSLFAAADFYLNSLNTDIPVLALSTDNGDVGSVVTTPTFTDSSFLLNTFVEDYKVVSQLQTSQVFEKIDLSNIKNIKTYRHQLKKEIIETEAAIPEPDESEPESDKSAPKTDKDSETIILYEILGSENQGNLTYLSVKLQFIAQINATTETLNETSDFGHNSLFFNDSNYINTGFLLTQISDNLYGFQYEKDNPEVYGTVKEIINKLMPKQ